MTVAAPLFSSARSDWQTPECVLWRVRQLGPVAIDPCAGGETRIGRVNLTGLGLDVSWLEYVDIVPDPERSLLAYVNPPYGRAMGAWMAKCREEGAAMDVVALVPARTDTAWFATIWDSARAICFWRGRITFVGAEHPAPFPSAVVYWGEKVAHFDAAFSDAGKVVWL